MKKIISYILSICILSSIFYTSYAEKAVSKPESVYTLSQVRKLALQNAESLDTYQTLYRQYEQEMLLEKNQLGESYQDYDENGKEITKYFSGGTLSYDYSSKLEAFERKIKNLKRQNELHAIEKYNQILSLQIDIQKKQNEISLQESTVLAEKKKFETGKSLLPDYELATAQLKVLKSDIDILQTNLNALYEDMNRLLGLPKTARYELDRKGLLAKVNIGDIKLSLPIDAIEYVRKDSDTIRDMEKNIREKKKQLELFAKTYPEGSDEYRVQEKALDIYGLKKDLQKTSDSLYFTLEEDYLNILITLMKVSDTNDELHFTEYQSGIVKAKYQTGFISKLEFITDENQRLDMQNTLYTMVLDSYHQIVQYEIKTGKNLIE